MYDWVKDKILLKTTYSESADVVNRLVQELKRCGIQARMNVVGSKLRNMVLRNGKGQFDYDFNVWIENANQYDEKWLKETVKEAFDYVLEGKGWKFSKDSTSVLTARKKDNSIFSIDVCIVKKRWDGRLERLIHEKTGNVDQDRYFWNVYPELEGLKEKEEKLKPEHWSEVRENYKSKKNIYLQRKDKNHKSFNCYIEAVNEVYDKYYNRMGTLNMGCFSNQVRIIKV